MPPPADAEVAQRLSFGGPRWRALLRARTVRGVLGVVVTLASHAFYAPQASAREQDQHAFLTLTVNGLPFGEVLAVIRGAEVMVPVEALERAGLQVTGRRELIGQTEHIALSSLAPAVRSSLDEPTLTLQLTARPDLFRRTVRRLQRARPEGITFRRSPSAFLNYAVTRRDGDVALATEGGLRLGPALAAATFTTSFDGRQFRGPASVTFDDRRRLTRWVVGDVTAGTACWERALWSPASAWLATTHSTRTSSPTPLPT